jgi:hypothetical protein
MHYVKLEDWYLEVNSHEARPSLILNFGCSYHVSVLSYLTPLHFRTASCCASAEDLLAGE